MTEFRTLDDYLSLLRRRKWIVLQAVVLVPLTALIISLRQAAVYQSSAEVLLNRQDLASQLLGLQSSNLTTDPDRYALTQADVALVPALARRVVRAAGVPRSTDDLLGAATIAPKSGSDVLVFSVRDQDKRVAEKLATAYAHEFTTYRRELDTAALLNARKQLQTRLKQLRASGISRTDREYQTLVDKEQQLGTLMNLQTSNAQVIRNADGAGKVEPQPRRSATLGLLGGLVLGIALAFLVDALDRRVRTADEIEAQLRIPLLGRLSEPSRDRRRAEELVMVADPSHPEADGYRLIRTNLAFLNADENARVIMVTSGVPGEGKSTTVANLAVAMARSGSRVLLVDLDLHSPSIHRLFSIPSRPGFTDVTLDPKRLKEAINTVSIAGATPDAASSDNGKGLTAPGTVGLDVLPAGMLPLNAGEFVESKAAATALAELGKQYDYVLIDTPPLLAMGDAVALSARVDALIVVARLGFLERSNLRDLARTLKQCPAAKLGVVVTGTAPQTYYYRAPDYPRGRESERKREVVS